MKPGLLASPAQSWTGDRGPGDSGRRRHRNDSPRKREKIYREGGREAGMKWTFVGDRRDNFPGVTGVEANDLQNLIPGYRVDQPPDSPAPRPPTTNLNHSTQSQKGNHGTKQEGLSPHAMLRGVCGILAPGSRQNEPPHQVPWAEQGRLLLFGLCGSSQ
jgi:hypothetical protein